METINNNKLKKQAEAYTESKILLVQISFWLKEFDKL